MSATEQQFDEAEVRAALEQESVPDLKVRVAEMNDWRAQHNVDPMPTSGPKTRLIDALVASYKEAGLTTDGAIEPVDEEMARDFAGELVREAAVEHASTPEPSAGEEQLPPQPGSELVPLGPPEAAMPSQQEYASMREIAREIAETEFVPGDFRGRPDAILAAIMTGRELGIGPMQALKQVTIIDGRPALAAELMLALMRKAGVVILESVATADRAEIKARRGDSGEVMTVDWTKQEAIDAGLAQKPNFKRYPSDMLWARAVGRLARRLCPDVIGGLGYSAEEVADFGAWDETPPASAPQPRQAARPADWLPPTDWRNLWERFSVAIGDTSTSKDEAAEWMAEAVQAKFGKATSELAAAERDDAWQLFLRALVTLDMIGPDGIAFAEDPRKLIATALHEFGEVNGPAWRLAATEDLPSHAEAHGLPEPEAPIAEAVDAEWTDADPGDRQAAWDAYVAVERESHPQWQYPDDVPDDWTPGTEHIPF